MEDQNPVWGIRFYGTRGSIAVPESGFQQYGGNTTCVMVDLLGGTENNIIGIFDAGTGIRQLGKDIMSGAVPRPKVIFLAFTHFHWDHIAGFPFFAPFYMPEFEVQIFAPHELARGKTLKDVFALPLQEEYFPVQLDQMGVDFQFLSPGEFQKDSRLTMLDSFEHQEHPHPGGAFGYRIEAEGRSVAFCTDIEHGETVLDDVVEFCKGADLLIHDAQYTSEELTKRRGWGHSSYEQAIEVAQRAGVKQLLMTHHDPDHDDDFLREQEARCRKLMPNCGFAYDGLEVKV